mmetsp:Transcript_14885/g.38426  ORF Transcript_14885/g.38426 Transcript_14885/m.38426 type:complete len:200 (-) Transcript_14885:697-1296(-)
MILRYAKTTLSHPPRRGPCHTCNHGTYRNVRTTDARARGNRGVTFTRANATSAAQSERGEAPQLCPHSCRAPERPCAQAYRRPSAILATRDAAATETEAVSTASHSTARARAFHPQRRSLRDRCARGLGCQWPCIGAFGTFGSSPGLQPQFAHTAHARHRLVGIEDVRVVLEDGAQRGLHVHPQLAPRRRLVDALQLIL